jgi:YD repeat-containing protein
MPAATAAPGTEDSRIHGDARGGAPAWFGYDAHGRVAGQRRPGRLFVRGASRNGSTKTWVPDLPRSSGGSRPPTGYARVLKVRGRMLRSRRVSFTTTATTQRQLSRAHTPAVPRQLRTPTDDRPRGPSPRHCETRLFLFFAGVSREATTFEIFTLLRSAVRRARRRRLRRARGAGTLPPPPPTLAQPFSRALNMSSSSSPTKTLTGSR